ncbi:MAG TPA: hypothetical protein DDW52_17215 [Planctomycetaceae bacterium]|nr:hypothetical protein [Planctomycetaceae bacterium]
MLLQRSRLLAAVVFSLTLFGELESAQAGPLIDWLFGRRTSPAYPVGGPVPVGNTAGYAPYSSGYSPYSVGYAPYNSLRPPVFSGPGYAPPSGLPTTVTPRVPTTYSYVPNYRTNYYRAPVTYYRPLMKADPTTGAQTVHMAPCTSYEYQTQRIPTWGQSTYYGNFATQAPIVSPPAGTTYTLPRGGLPLTQSTAPAISSPAASNYTTLQPPITSMPPSTASTYPTSPYGTSPYSVAPSTYYGTTTGGCTGSAPAYAPPPGLTAPPAPTTAPPANPGIFPPENDPANTRPSLSGGPISSPESSASSLANSAPTAKRFSVTETREASTPSFEAARNSEPPRLPSRTPSTKPIPAPRDFDAHQNWNPGLIREEDLTAHHSPPAKARLAYTLAGQSKTIQWASFEQASNAKPRLGRNALPAEGIQLEMPVGQTHELSAPIGISPSTPNASAYASGETVLRRVPISRSTKAAQDEMVPIRKTPFASRN